MNKKEYYKRLGWEISNRRAKKILGKYTIRIEFVSIINEYLLCITYHHRRSDIWFDIKHKKFLYGLINIIEEIIDRLFNALLSEGICDVSRIWGDVTDISGDISDIIKILEEQ